MTETVRRRSPLIAGRRLAKELRQLRERTILDDAPKPPTSEQLARVLGWHHSKLSRIENNKVIARVEDVTEILRALGMSPPNQRDDDGDGAWHLMIDLAQNAADRGWWASYPAIGPRQAVYANLEYGAREIREFQSFAVPGLLHLPEYTRAQDNRGLGEPQLERAVEAKLMRGRMLRRPDGPSYEVVIDESAVRRPSAPPEIMLRQVEHLATLAEQDGQTTILILPQRATIAGYWMPRGPFSLYEFGGGDPTAVAVDTELNDLIFTEADKVGLYGDQYARLREAALSSVDSAAWLRAETQLLQK